MPESGRTHSYTDSVKKAQRACMPGDTAVAKQTYTPVLLLRVQHS